MSQQPRLGNLDLYWLPPTENWTASIKRLEEHDALDDAAASWSALGALAGTQLDFLRIARLDRSLTRLFGEIPPPGLSTRPVRLAVLASSTVDQLLPAIRVAGLRRGLWITIYEADYGQYRQELLDSTSRLHGFRPDAVLFALDAPHLMRRADPALDDIGAAQALEDTVGDMRSLWQAARAAFRCQMIQQTVLPVFPNLLGLNEHRLPGSQGALTAKLNAALRQAAADEDVALLSLDSRAATDGVYSWHDPKLWHRAKQEISPAAAPMYGDLVGRLLAAMQGRAAKCLVLDLDNTLWGGVIGDDGLDGIEIGQGSALGEAFSAFQTYAAGLAKRGIILAACSKNDEANAVEVFEKHPEMVLRRPDLSALVANWNDKASNLRKIADILKIGLDALVFVDDNPFERNLVRRELPMVAVPEVPDDPALFARCIGDAGYFESLGVTDEDRGRTHLYQANAQREALQGVATDMSAYLRSLDMTVLWRRFDRTGLKRVTQLINKTNQFNLTTQRYTEEEVAAITSDSSAVGLQLRLIDRFGDNGIIAVVIGRMIGETLELDSWLMSCRVLGREMEQATLAIVVGEARRLGASRLLGRYRPTVKNAMVADHYARLGFAAMERGDGSGEDALYDLELTGHIDADVPIVVREE